MESRFAILALMLLSLLAFQFAKHLTLDRQNMIRSEVQLIASGIGTEYLEETSTLDYEGIHELNGDTQTKDVVINGETFSFDLQTQVRFMEKGINAFVSTTEATDFQEVRVTIKGLLNTSISMSRIYYRTQPN